ncbi:MAG: glycosyltransferase family 2 protein [Corynebacterium sp.]|nr:glycosyltransferase family 2 protein [Corynebacterium sp.]
MDEAQRNSPKSASADARKGALPIITVTYSPGEHLSKFIESTKHAYSGDTRIILADNGSRDGVPEAAAQAHDNVDFLPTGGNLGYGTAMNIGARYAAELPQDEIDQDFLLIVNPDVQFLPGCLDELIAAMERHPEAGSVGPQILEPNGDIYPSARAIPNLKNGIGHALLGQLWKNNPWTKAYRDNSVMDKERPAGWLSGSCLLVRRQAFEKIGGFDERYFMYMEDVDLGDRLGRAGYSNIYVPSAQITHDQGHAAKTVPVVMLRAHHESAYRFQADRLNAWWQMPIRLVLRLGLVGRCVILSMRARKAAK